MKRIAGLAIAVVVVSSACATLQVPWKSSAPPVQMGATNPDGGGLPPGAQAGLPLSSEQRFPDVPLPVGLTADPERTFAYNSAGLQVGRLVYTTRAPRNDLGQFYLTEAPAAGWKFENMVEADTLEIYFSKPGKKLTVNVRPLGVGRGRQLILIYTPDGGATL